MNFSSVIKESNDFLRFSTVRASGTEFIQMQFKMLTDHYYLFFTVIFSSKGLLPCL